MARRFLDAGSKIGLTVVSPAGDVVLFLPQSPGLGLDILADPAIVVHVTQVASVGQLGSTGLTDPGLSFTSKFHIAPFEITAAIVGPCVITHCVWFAAATTD